MRDRPAFELKRPLLAWNAALAVFSILGFVRFGEVILCFTEGIIVDFSIMTIFTIISRKI